MIFTEYARKQLLDDVEFDTFKEEYVMIDTFEDGKELKEKMTAIFYSGKVTKLEIDSTKTILKIHAKAPTVEMRFFDV